MKVFRKLYRGERKKIYTQNDKAFRRLPFYCRRAAVTRGLCRTEQTFAVKHSSTNAHALRTRVCIRILYIKAGKTLFVYSVEWVFVFAFIH